MNNYKRYTIRYSYAGINQYADLNYSGDTLVHCNFMPRYCKGVDIPSLDGLNDIADIISVIEKFSGRKAEVYLIDYELAEYYLNAPVKEVVHTAKAKYDEFVTTLVREFFDSVLLPIIIENDWKITRSWVGVPVLIEMREGEWDNVKSSDPKVVNFEYICYKFSHGILGKGDKMELITEQSWHIDADRFKYLYGYLDDEKLTELGILITLP
jgi:hypothetical protein